MKYAAAPGGVWLVTLVTPRPAPDGCRVTLAADDVG